MFSGRPTYVFFHTIDAYLYREAVNVDDEKILDALPVGLTVRFDALSVKTNCREVRVYSGGSNTKRVRISDGP